MVLFNLTRNCLVLSTGISSIQSFDVELYNLWTNFHVLFVPTFSLLSKILFHACNSWRLINMDLTKYARNLNWRNNLLFFIFFKLNQIVGFPSIYYLAQRIFIYLIYTLYWTLVVTLMRANKIKMQLDTITHLVFYIYTICIWRIGECKQKIWLNMHFIDIHIITQQFKRNEKYFFYWIIRCLL